MIVSHTEKKDHSAKKWKNRISHILPVYILRHCVFLWTRLRKSERGTRKKYVHFLFHQRTKKNMGPQKLNISVDKTTSDKCDAKRNQPQKNFTLFLSVRAHQVEVSQSHRIPANFI